MTLKKPIDFQKCNALPPVWCETVYPDIPTGMWKRRTEEIGAILETAEGKEER